MKRLLALVLLLTVSLGLDAAHIETLIDLTIKAEDASYYHRIKSLRFNGLEITLDAPDMFKPRKTVDYKLPPGRYMLNWSTEKSGGRWQEEGNKSFERILVLESGDTAVRVAIKGDTITLY
jgi:hypothetical protein